MEEKQPVVLKKFESEYHDESFEYATLDNIGRSKFRCMEPN